jgi:enterochelin esterase family protein
VNDQLDLFWIGCGTEDGVITGARRFDEFLTSNKIEHTFRQISGEHTWIVWRRFLNEVAPLLWTRST